MADPPEAQQHRQLPPTARDVAVQLTDVVSSAIQLIRETVADVCSRLPTDPARELRQQSTDFVAIDVLRDHLEGLADLIAALWKCHTEQSTQLKRVAAGVDALGDGSDDSPAARAVREFALCLQHATHLTFYESLFEESLMAALPASQFKTTQRVKHRAAHASLLSTLASLGGSLHGSMAFSTHDVLQALLHTATIHIRYSDVALCEALRNAFGNVTKASIYGGGIRFILESSTAGDEECCGDCARCVPLFWLELPRDCAGESPIEQRKKAAAPKPTATLKTSAGGWKPRSQRTATAPPPQPPPDDAK